MKEAKDMENMTVDEYKMKSREFEMAEAKKGLLAHSIITVAVVGLLTVIDMTLTPEVYWFIFPAIGMTVGVVVHYLFGVRFASTWMERKERRIEEWR